MIIHLFPFLALSGQALAIEISRQQLDNRVGAFVRSSDDSTNISTRQLSDLALAQDLVQAASKSTGAVGDAEAGQVNSVTSQNNFIDDCAGLTLTNGAQVAGGSCNGITMGEIPSQNKMVSTIITSPLNGGTLAANQDFNISMQIANLETGSFTNPLTTYYAAPQALDAQGLIIGHVHVTVQSLNSLNQQQPLDASKFAFFKGINNAANSQGKLTTLVPGGLPAGTYRVCTMSSASNHQSVLMPVAQRGAQDDCVRFSVSATSANTAAKAKQNTEASGSSATATSTVETSSIGFSTSTTSAAALNIGKESDSQAGVGPTTSSSAVRASSNSGTRSTNKANGIIQAEAANVRNTLAKTIGRNKLGKRITSGFKTIAKRSQRITSAK